MREFELLTSLNRGSHGAFVVYDITNRQSFDRLSVWLGCIDNQILKYPKELQSVMIIGNKVVIFAFILISSSWMLSKWNPMRDK